MLENWLVAAVRNLLRNRVNTLVSVFGLFLGFTAAILIALYVRDEYSYDQHIPDGERVYQVGELISPPGRAPRRVSRTSVTDAPALKLTFPEIELTTRLAIALDRLRRTGAAEPTDLRAYWVDPNFFEMFPMHPISGSLDGALDQPDTVVLTRKATRQFFGDQDPIGRTIDVVTFLNDLGMPLDIERTNVMRVVAVVEDLPSNGHLDVEVFLPGIASFSWLSMREAQQSRPGAFRIEDAYTYVRLHAGASIESVESRLRAFVDSHLSGNRNGNGTPIASTYTFTLTRLTDIHLAPPSIGAIKPPSDPRVIQAFAGIALLILFVACGNFVSMMTARVTRRAMEVGVRKASGATWLQIMAQFLGESLLYAALALVPAIIAVNLLLPAFNGFLQRQIAFDLIGNPDLAAGIIGLGIVTGIAAGVYPALYLSRFRPSLALKGLPPSLPGSGRLRQGLVIFQFATLITLVVATFTIYRQTQYAIEDRLRVSADTIYIGSQSVICSRTLVEMTRAIDAIRTASCAGGAALYGGDATSVMSLADNAVAVRGVPLDAALFDVLDIQPVAGRLLSTEHGADDLLRNGNDIAENPSLIVNESAVRALGFSSPSEAIGKFPRWTRLALVNGKIARQEAASSEIVGVVPDFSLGSVRDAIGPTAYYLDPTLSGALVLRFKGDAIQEGMEAVSQLWAQQSSRPFDGTFLSQRINDLYADIRAQSTILAVFSSVAVVLAALGILGLAMFAAERRTKEIGLRKVMGALRTDVLRLMGWQFARPVLIANLIAWPVAYFVMTRWLEGFAYHIELEPWTFVLAGLMALLIALASVAGHALLVARAHPVAALRHE